MPVDRKLGQLPEGCQVLCISHGGVKATSESHVDVEAHAWPCAHLCKENMSQTLDRPALVVPQQSCGCDPS